MRPSRQRQSSDDFLLACLRAACDGPGGRLPDPPADLDVDGFLERARREGILLALLPLFATLPDEDVAAALAEAASRWRGTLEAAHRRGLTTLADVVGALGGSGIPFAVLKGPALALRLHDGEPVRLYGDLDVIVPVRYRRPAFAALLGDEYRAKDTGFTRWLVRLLHFHDILDARRDSRTRIELHWNLLDRCNLYRIPEDELFSRLETVAWRDTRVPMLAREDDFIYLAIHAAKHGVLNQLALARGEAPSWYCGGATGNRLRWFHDLHSFIGRLGETLDWNLVRQRAIAWNAMSDLESTLRVLATLLPGPRVDEALRRLGVTEPRSPAGATGLIGRIDRSPLGRRLLAASLEPNRRLTFRPIRLLLLARAFFPSSKQLSGFYREARPLRRSLLYLTHPVRMFLRQFSWSLR